MARTGNTCHATSATNYAGFASRATPGYCNGMIDLKLQVPRTDKVHVDAETLSAIDLGIKDADEGRTVSIDDARKMIPKWT